MLTNILVLLGSVLGFVFMLVLLQAERAREERIMLPRVRAGFDRVIHLGARGFATIRMVVGRFVLQLGFRYVVHVILRSVLLGMARLYDRLVAYFEYNRRRTKAIRKAKQAWGATRRNHLTELQEHRDRHTLTDSEKQARKQAALEGD